ncbi:MAG: hypothetical protein BWK80_40870 [Desulfobacteraceae bacterium IS3]|nr:MAG: hypothetical protein BWK80_40870 [Desulfobacteraceae bacterium IS3]HAO23269.1 hypothetical protein [Desulfobacteraceae bacterium]
MINIAKSVNNIPIRLTDERWRHIVENHNEMASRYFEVLEAVAIPEYILEGDEGELWAFKALSPKKAMIVIYREFVSQKDGFIITAFLTNQIKKYLRRRILWQPQARQL